MIIIIRLLGSRISSISMCIRIRGPRIVRMRMGSRWGHGRRRISMGMGLSWGVRVGRRLRGVRRGGIRRGNRLRRWTMIGASRLGILKWC